GSECTRWITACWHDWATSCRGPSSTSSWLPTASLWTRSETFRSERSPGQCSAANSSRPARFAPFENSCGSLNKRPGAEELQHKFCRRPEGASVQDTDRHAVHRERKRRRRMGVSGASLRNLPVRPGRKAVESSAGRRTEKPGRKKARAR